MGGYLICVFTGTILPGDFITGIHLDFKVWSIVYSLIKMMVFAFIITSVSSFFGYHAKGNSLEVARSSTQAVVASSITILIFNLILTQWLLI